MPSMTENLHAISNHNRYRLILINLLLFQRLRVEFRRPNSPEPVIRNSE